MIQNLSVNILSYLIAVISTVSFIVYAFRIPYILTNNNPLVKEYYQTNFVTNVPFDILTITLYLGVAWLIVYVFNVTDKTIQFLIIGLTTMFLTFSFWLIFTHMDNDSFFTRWFKSIGLRAIVYDVIIVEFTFFAYILLRNFVLH